MQQLGKRFQIFGLGIILGAVMAGFIVWQHNRASDRVAARAESQILDPQLPDDVRDAVVGILRYYGEGRGPIQHRLMQAVRTTEKPGPMRRSASVSGAEPLPDFPSPIAEMPSGAFGRELILQGELSEQRLLVREIVLPPPVLEGTPPSELSSEQLAGCAVIGWSILRPDELILFPQPGSRPASIASEVAPRGWILQRELSGAQNHDADSPILVTLPHGSLQTIPTALKEIRALTASEAPWLLGAAEHLLASGHQEKGG
ncbi:MAG: hypothetical protein ACFB21_00505 [Opitutales bacterium]